MSAPAVPHKPVALPYGLDSFVPKVSFSLELGGFVVKTADTPAQVRQALSLRHEAFFAERLGVELPGRLDADAFDAQADHILVVDQATGRLAAAYRILCSLFVGRFYSEQQFEMRGLLTGHRVRLELGRACTSREHRGGVALGLVWKGLARYARLTGAAELFGTSSMDGVEAETAAGVAAYLRAGGQTADFGVVVRPPYRFAAPLPSIPAADGPRYKDLVPPLLRAYLRAGAVVCSEPSVDRELKTTDFLTLLNLAGMNPRFAARFFS